MAFRSFLVGAGILVVLGLLGFRILDLEQRVAELDKLLAAREPEPAAQQAAFGNGPTMASKETEARLQALERRLTALETPKSASPLPTGTLGEDRLHQEQAILSVMERENGRIRDVQLEWHKARWLETRKQQLAAFAYSQGLEPAQTVKIYEAIESELDGLVDVMKRPTFAEEPDQVASDWLGVLSQTDRRAQELLKPSQYQIWQQVRLFERKVLWPWLPDASPETAQR